MLEAAGTYDNHNTHRIEKQIGVNLVLQGPQYIEIEQTKDIGTAGNPSLVKKIFRTEIYFSSSEGNTKDVTFSNLSHDSTVTGYKFMNQPSGSHIIVEKKSGVKYKRIIV